MLVDPPVSHEQATMRYIFAWSCNTGGSWKTRPAGDYESSLSEDEHKLDGGYAMKTSNRENSFTTSNWKV